jgi:hypothetical protein
MATVMSMSCHARLANNFGQMGALWQDGDFNGDGVAGFADFLMLADNFGEHRNV